MNIVEIFEKKVKQYKETQKEIAQRRKLWNERVKEWIFQTLNNVAQKFEMDWFVAKDEAVQNLQSVSLIFGNTPSGIIKDRKMAVKVGGYLSYVQSINGKIDVSIDYPYVEGFTNRWESKHLGVYEPKQIAENIVYENVDTFLSEIIDWENA